jgi:hypothetical protein
MAGLSLWRNRHDGRTSSLFPHGGKPVATVDLKLHGSASRCLLRVRENAGEDRVSDGEFIAKYVARFPGWDDRPGALSAAGIEDLAQELGIAASVHWTRDYDQLVADHAAGLSILVFTEHVPLPTGVGRRPHVTVSLLVDIDETSFVLWWPSPTGDGVELPRTDRVWWTRWPARAAVLRPEGSDGVASRMPAKDQA